MWVEFEGTQGVDHLLRRDQLLVLHLHDEVRISGLPSSPQQTELFGQLVQLDA